MKPRDLLSYAVLALVWGLSFIVVVRVVEAFGWAGAVTFRAVVAGATLFLLALITGRRLDFSCGWTKLAIMGALTVAGQLAGIAFSAPLIGTAMTAIMVSAIPLFSMVIGRLLGIEHLRPSGIVGIAMGITGIVMLVGFPAEPITPSFLLGCAVSILGSLSAALGSLYASARLRSIGAWETTIGSFLTGGLMTLPLILAVPIPAMPGLADFFWFSVLGIATSAFMYVIYFNLVATIGPTKAISVEFAVTVVAVLAGTMVLDEKLSGLQIAGAVIIVSGCALVLGLIPGLWRRAARA